MRSVYTVSLNMSPVCLEIHNLRKNKLQAGLESLKCLSKHAGGKSSFPAASAGTVTWIARFQPRSFSMISITVVLISVVILDYHCVNQSAGGCTENETDECFYKDQ